jgi:hypothetical protein
VNDLDQLTQLCARLGAAPGQARIMAAQLLKRSEQLAAERGITQTSALSYLIELVLKGRNGEPPPEFPPTSPPPELMK